MTEETALWKETRFAGDEDLLLKQQLAFTYPRQQDKRFGRNSWLQRPLWFCTGSSTERKKRERLRERVSATTSRAKLGRLFI